jgi:hypothetical protein
MAESNQLSLKEVTIQIGSTVTWLKSDDQKRDVTLMGYEKIIKTCIDSLESDKVRFGNVLSHLGDMIVNMRMISSGEPKFINMATAFGTKALDELNQLIGTTERQA